MEELMVTVVVYFEIRDSRMFGGQGTIGYSNCSVDVRVNAVKYEWLEKFIHLQKEIIADLCEIPLEKIKVISRNEYEENTDDEYEQNNWWDG